MKWIKTGTIIAFWMLLFLCKMDARADIQSPESLEGAEWAYQNEVSYIRKGWIQSTCVTEHYLIAFQNRSNKNSNPDTLIAFYKTDRDPDGNKVVPFTYAFHVTERDYEHGNGMTYNPNTNEIYITAGPLLNIESSGNVYAVDADTLYYKRTIKVGDGSTNFDFIGYAQDSNQYILQGDYADNHGFYIADENFNIIDSFVADANQGNRFFQDYCISGDYVLGISHHRTNQNENHVEVYSISQRKHLGRYYLDLSGGESIQEVESIAEISPGVLVVAVGITSPRRLRFYQAEVTAIFDVETSVSNGTITESTHEAVGGENYKVTFQSEKNYELAELLIDGEVVQSTPTQTEYVFRNLDASHTVEAIFGKIPKYKITTSVENGSITESKKVYRDRTFKVSYTPDKNHELGRIIVDGEEIDTSGFENGYEFENIQAKHAIQVIFDEIPSWGITTSVKNGSISDTTKKAYRDSNCTVSYEPDQDYILFSVKIDGNRVDRETYGSQYSFTNIHGPHTVEVVYIWMYLPVVLIAGFAILLVLAFRIWLEWKRKKRIQRDRELRRRRGDE